MKAESAKTLTPGQAPGALRPKHERPRFAMAEGNALAFTLAVSLKVNQEDGEAQSTQKLRSR